MGASVLLGVGIHFIIGTHPHPYPPPYITGDFTGTLGTPSQHTQKTSSKIEMAKEQKEQQRQHCHDLFILF